MKRFELVTDAAAASTDGEVVVWPRAASGSESLRTNVDCFLSRLGPVAGGAIDLVRLAAAALIADRRAPRRAGWSRTIEMRVHVTSLASWGTAIEPAADLLAFLTGDDWRLELMADASDRSEAASEAQPVERIVLFSGGLDSFAGALLALNRDTKVAFLSQRDNPIVAGSQDRTWEWLSQHVTDELVGERVLLGHGRSLLERSSRSRSMLFMALGVAVASARGASTLEIPENGFTSFNPPLGLDRAGTLSTRSTHPHTIQLMNEIVGRLGVPVTVENPYEWITKGELVHQADETSNHEIDSGVAETLSCGKLDGRWYPGGNSHLNCGLCVNCIIRRGSIRASGLSDETVYLVDMLGPTARTELIHARRGDLQAIRELVVKGITVDELIASAPYPLGYDLDRAAEVCGRAIEEAASIDIP